MRETRTAVIGARTVSRSDLHPVRFRRSPTALFRAVGPEVFLASLEREGFDQLSETATAVWRLLEVPQSLRELATILAEVYGEPRDVIVPDVEALVSDLVRRGWVEEVREP